MHKTACQLEKTETLTSQSADLYITQFFVFKGEQYLGWDCFNKERVTVGSTANADLFLENNNPAIGDKVISISGKNIKISGCQNHQATQGAADGEASILLGLLDTVDYGPYTLKIKRKRINKDRPHDNLEENGPLWSRESTSAGIAQRLTEGVNEHIQPVGNTAGEGDVKGVEDKERYPGSTDISTRANSDLFRLIFSGQIAAETRKDEIKHTLKRILKADDAQVELALSGTPVLLKCSNDWHKIQQVRLKLQKIGILCDIESVPPDNTSGGSMQKEQVTLAESANVALPDCPSAPITDTEAVLDHPQGLSNCSADSVTTPSGTRESELAIVQTADLQRPPLPVYTEDDDEDDDDIAASYSLKSIVYKQERHANQSASPAVDMVEVVRTRFGDVVDICFLNPKEKYWIRTDKKRFCLVENKRASDAWIYYTPEFTGFRQNAESETSDVHQTHAPDYSIGRKKNVFTSPVPRQDGIVFDYGHDQFLVQWKTPAVTVPVTMAPKPESDLFKYLVKSVVFHTILLFVFGLFATVQSPPLRIEEGHFVKIDASQYAEIKKRTTPQPPKPKTVPIKPKVLAQTPPAKKKTVPRQTRKTTRKAVASRHPKAGGGYGKGNVANRNVNQAGILSMLGNSVGLKPQEAMAAVTNLDAVATTGKPDSGFKVGGIAGKLGNRKVEMTQGGIVQTRGATQVLRSAGAGGSGRVAAMEKGKTGQKQVKGMVSAKLTQTVRVNGGMSREAVKRVIDQHLDEISNCYETALIVNPSIMGKVVFEWKILTSGRVGAVRIKSSSINSNDIHSCIQAAIKSWQFPKPTGREVVVSYPFIFDVVGF